MAISSSLVLYRPGPASSLTTSSSRTSLISSHLFSQQTGTAIATELLYRILFDIINRFISSFQRLTSKGIEEASSWIEQKMAERRDKLAAAKCDAGDDLKIVKEVGTIAQESGFIACPMGRTMGGEAGARFAPTPPMWVRGVLEGIEEGRLHDKDFYTNSW
jgi:hypothetical protein